MAARPASLSTIAILQIVFGSLGLLGGACAPWVLLEGAAGTRVTLPLASGAIAYGVLGAVMLAGGVGLLNLRPWGRTVTMAWGGLSVVFHVLCIAAIVGFAFDESNRLWAAYPARRLSDQARAILAGGVVVNALAALYSVYVFLRINRPEVSDAFCPATRSPLDDARP